MVAEGELHDPIPAVDYGIRCGQKMVSQVMMGTWLELSAIGSVSRTTKSTG